MIFFKYNSLLVLTCFFLLLCSIASYSSQREYTFVTGNWRGQAHYQEDGRFKSCTMAASYKSGTEIYFVIDEKFSWVLGMTNPDWSFSAGQVKQVEIILDKNPPIQAELTMLSANGFSILFQDQPKGLESFKNGSELNLAFDGYKARFELKGTKRAVEDLINCVVARTSYIAPPERNPKRPVFTIPEPQSAKKQDEAGEKDLTTGLEKDQKPLSEMKPLLSEKGGHEKHQRAMEIARKILRKNGQSGYEFLDVKEHSRSGFDVMWVFGDKTFGGLSLSEWTDSLDLDKEVGKILGEDSALCNGTFASVKKIPQQIDNRQIRHLSMACEATSGASKFKYALIKYSNNILLKFIYGRPASLSEPEDEVSERMLDAWMMPEEEIFSSLTP